MAPLKKCSLWIGVAVIGALGAAGSTFSAEPPPVSHYAPAEDLVCQVDQYLQNLEKVVRCEEEYNDQQEKLAKDSNTLVVLALALGLHDQPNRYRDSAGALVEAAQAVAAAKDYRSAREAVAAVKDAVEGKRKSNAALRWEAVASLPELMKQVPLISTKLKRSLKGDRFEQKAACSAGQTAVLAVIAQGTLADTSAAGSDEQARQWREFSARARDLAGELNAAIHRCDRKAADCAMERLNQSCEDCHAVFKPEEK